MCTHEASTTAECTARTYSDVRKRVRIVGAGNTNSASTTDCTTCAQVPHVKTLRPEFFHDVSHIRVHIDAWLFLVEQYFELIRVDEAMQVGLTAAPL